MATPLAELGQNTEIDENSSGETIIRNTQTGTEVRLADFVDIVGPLGDSSNPVAGTSHFESVNTDELLNGVAGEGNSIGDIVGDSGEYLVTSTVAILPGERATITSDTFADVGSSKDFVSKALPSPMTNANKQVVKVSGRVNAIDQDATVRYRGNASTEVTVSGTGSFEGDYAEVSRSDAMIQARLNTQTGTDEVEIERLNITYALEIGT